MSVIDGYGIIKVKLISSETIYYKAYIPNNLLHELKKYIVYK